MSEPVKITIDDVTQVVIERDALRVDVARKRELISELVDHEVRQAEQIAALRYKHGLMVAALEQIRDVAYRGTDDVALLRIQAAAVNVLALARLAADVPATGETDA